MTQISSVKMVTVWDVPLTNELEGFFFFSRNLSLLLDSFDWICIQVVSMEISNTGHMQMYMEMFLLWKHVAEDTESISELLYVFSNCLLLLSAPPGLKSSSSETEREKLG